MGRDSATLDRRVERSKAAVLDETYRQLSRNGLANVSIDEISRASGVSKTTIYRHWPSRSALLIDACSKLGGVREVPDTGELKSDLLALASSLVEHLETAVWSSVLPSIIDAAERDPDVSAMQAAWHDGLMTPFEEVTGRAQARGELRLGRHSGDVAAAVLGPLFYRRWFSREPIDRRFLEAVVASAEIMTIRRSDEYCTSTSRLALRGLE